VFVIGRIGDIPEKWRDLLGQRDYTEGPAEKLWQVKKKRTEK
jgi:hypothetical protein